MLNQRSMATFHRTTSATPAYSGCSSLFLPKASRASSHTELIVEIIVVLLLGYGIYYFSRKVKAK